MKYFFIITINAFLAFNGLSQNKSFPCENIGYSKDPFTGETTWRSPVWNQLRIIKIINIDTSYFLSLSLYSSILSVDKVGVFVLFADGTIWSQKTAKVKIDVCTSKWKDYFDFEYSSFVKLSEPELNEFESKVIRTIRLYVYDWTFPESEAIEFKNYVSCARNAKLD